MSVDVKISGLDEERTHPSGHGVLDDVFLTLEPRPTNEWAQLFDALWTQHFYMMKRRAQVVGNGLIVTTTVGELGDGLLDELKKIAAQTNAAVREQAAERNRQQQALIEQEKARREALAADAKKLNFD
jgi:uncharacterized protein YdbL (DUF1318 family)